MAENIKELLDQLDKAIETLQDIQADSSTPLEAAIAVVPPIRDLDRSRDALLLREFTRDVPNPKYDAAVAKLKDVAAASSKELKTHESNMKFVTAAAQAADAVIKVAIAVGAMVA